MSSDLATRNDVETGGESTSLPFPSSPHCDPRTPATWLRAETLLSAARSASAAAVAAGRLLGRRTDCAGGEEKDLPVAAAGCPRVVDGMVRGF
jgi:hypothetical protein